MNNRLLLLKLSTFICLNFVAACGGGGSSPTPPTANSASLKINEDTVGSGRLTGTAGEGGVLSYSISRTPSNGQIELLGSEYTYTPNVDYYGNDSFTFTVTEGKLSSSIATVSISIDAVNDAPSANSITFDLEEDIEFSGTLPVSDIDNSSLFIDITTSPQSGELVIKEDNSFIYTPAENYFGEDSVSFVASDEEFATEEVTVTFSVSPINDAPIANDISLSVLADSEILVNLGAVDLENTPLSYNTSLGFEKALIIDGPSNVGELTLEIPYGTYGSDLMEFFASDGELDSNIANIELDILVPLTKPRLNTHRFGSNQGALGTDVIEYNGKVVIVGFTNGVVDEHDAEFQRQAFFRVFDQDNNLENTIHVSMGETSMTQATLVEHNGKLVMFGVFREEAYFISLSESYEVEISKPINLPYSIERTIKNFDIAYIPDVGFYLIGSDMQMSWIDFDGNIRSTNVIESENNLDIHSWVIRDVREANEEVNISMSFYVCIEESDNCASGSGLNTGLFLLKADKTGGSIETIEITGAFVDDSAILSDGSLVQAVNSRLSLFDPEGNILWTRANNGGVQSNIEVGADDHIYWWNSRYNTNSGDASRVAPDNELQWKTTIDMQLESFDRLNEMVIDDYGNMFISYVDEFGESPNRVGAFHLLHVDYSGGEQWHEISETSSVRGSYNSENRVTMLTENNKFVSLAADRASPRNGFLFLVDVDRVAQ